MFNKFKIILIGLMTCMLASCQSDSNMDEITIDSTNNMVELTSSMSQSDFLSTCVKIKSQIGSVSRTTQISEAEAQQLMQPFIEDGLQLRSQIVRQAELEQTMNEEVIYFKNLSDEDCAALSFVFHSIKEAGLETEFVTTTFDEIETQRLSVSSERLLHCAAAAVGLNAIKEIGVSGVVTAATVRQAVIAIGKRYLGYIGLALMVYDFVECIR